MVCSRRSATRVLLALIVWLTTALISNALLVQPAAAAAATSIKNGLQLTITSVNPDNKNWLGVMEFDRTNIIGWEEQNPPTLTPGELDISVYGGTSRLPVRLRLAAPRGEAFRIGATYDNNDAYTGESSGEFAISSLDCSGVKFTVFDVASSQGRLTRLDARFAVTCTTSVPQLIGEVVLGEDDGHSILRSARNPGWFDVPLGTTSLALIPLWYRNPGTSAVPVGQAVLGGPNAADFDIVTDGCSGRSLSPGAGCALWARFHPSRTGSRSATVALRIADRTFVTPLTGSVPDGHTSLIMRSPKGDWVGYGKNYLITDAQWPMDTDHSHYRGAVRFFTRNGVDIDATWYVELNKAGGDPLTVGTYVTSDDPKPGQLLFDIGGEGRGCDHPSGVGKVTIRQIAFTSSGLLSRIDLTFSQPCAETPSLPMTGQLSYRSTLDPPALSAPFALAPGQSLRSGQTLTNTADFGHSFALGLSSSGSAQLKHDGAVVWATPAAGPGAQLTLTSGGSLTLLNAAQKVIWSVPAQSPAAVALVLQTDGDLALDRADGSPQWRTNTVLPRPTA